MANRREQRALVVEVASPLLDRLLTACAHTTAVAANGRPVWLVFSGEAVALLTATGLRKALTSKGQAHEAAIARREALGLPDVTTYFDTFRTLPVRLLVHPHDMRDQGVEPADFSAPLPVERIDRQTLIAEAASDAWMVF